MKTKYIFIDFDGVIADLSKGALSIPNEPLSKYANDLIARLTIVKTNKTYDDVKFILWSSQQERNKPLILEFLKNHKINIFDDFLLRSNKDKRKNYITKAHLLLNYMNMVEFNLVPAYDNLSIDIEVHDDSKANLEYAKRVIDNWLYKTFFWYTNEEIITWN